MKVLKYFDKEGREVPPSKAAWAQELEHGKDGRILWSRRFRVVKD